MLLTYVKKSKLTRLINEFDEEAQASEIDSTPNKTYLLQLIEALKNGNTEDPIFTRPKCEFYLTYLYLCQQYLAGEIDQTSDQGIISSFLSKLSKKAKTDVLFISKDDFMQGYLYLLAKESYGNQALVLKTNQPEHHDIFDQYLNNLQKYYPHISREASEAKLHELSGMSCTFLAVKSSTVHSKDSLFMVLEKPAGILFPESGSPINQVIYDTTHSSYYLVPSIHFVHWLGGDGIQMEPCFGIVGTEKLYQDFHLKHKRPITLASHNVRDNLTQAHDKSATPLSVALHDSHYHFMALALFPENIFNFITLFILPKLQEAARHEARIKQAIEYLNDFATNSSTNDKEPASENALNYLVTGLKQNKYSFYFGVIKLIPVLIQQKREIQQQFGIDIHLLINKFSPYQDDLMKYLPQFEQCGVDQAQDIYFALCALSSEKLLNDFNANLFFTYPRIALDIAKLIQLIKKYPQLVNNQEILSNLCQIDASEGVNAAKNLANYLMLAVDNDITFNLELVRNIIDKKPDISFDEVVILNQHADLLLSQPERLDGLLTYPLITSSLIHQTNPSYEKTKDALEKTLKELKDSVHDPFLELDDCYQYPFHRLSDSFSKHPLLQSFLDYKKRSKNVDKTIQQLYRFLSEDKSIAGEHSEHLNDYIQHHKKALTRDSFLTIFYLLDSAHIPISKKSLDLIFQYNADLEYYESHEQLIYPLLNIINDLELTKTHKSKAVGVLGTQFLENLLSLPPSRLKDLSNICTFLMSSSPRNHTFFEPKAERQTNPILKELALAICSGKTFPHEQLEKLRENHHISEKLNQLGNNYPEIMNPVLELVHTEEASPKYSPPSSS